jgi:segregation and condensation protein B
MRKREPTLEPAVIKPTANSSNESPLSLSRLREAFAAMLGEQPAGSQPESPRPSQGERDRLGNAEQHSSLSYQSARNTTAPCEISAKSVVEAILFVGEPDNRPFSARELAAAMRGVSPTEIEAAVQELNEIYDADRAPYRIEQTGAGYRMVLRDEFQRMREKFYGRVKEARLSPAVLEVLSILAYNQPITAARLNELRGVPSGSALSTLVRRRLAKVERSVETGGEPRYSTTERFLKVFSLESLDALPRAEELEKL